jgi:hypothetical protein
MKKEEEKDNCECVEKCNNCTCTNKKTDYCMEREEGCTGECDVCILTLMMLSRNSGMICEIPELNMCVNNNRFKRKLSDCLISN